MPQAELLCHMAGHGRRAVAFGGMVAASQEGHTGLARQVGLRFGDLTRDERVGTGCYRGFEVALRTCLLYTSRCV